MRTVKNTIRCTYGVGDRIRFLTHERVDGDIVITKIAQCNTPSCHNLLEGTCTGYYLYDTSNHAWHDILCDFQLVSRNGGE